MELMITIAIVLILFTLFSLSKWKKKKRKNYQLQGILFVCQVKNTISLIQEHRGLSTAWLNGDVKVQDKLPPLKKKISNNMYSLSLTSIKSNERYDAFSDHWQRLLKIEKNASAINNFEQHTLMIRNLAYLLEDTAESYQLTGTYFNQLENIGYVWRELILAIESLGQSRAIGTGVATQQHCSSVDKIKLEFLIQRMTELSDQALKNLSYLKVEEFTHNQLLGEAIDYTNHLISMMSLELVNTEKVTINNREYFSLASSAMSKMNDIFDHQIKQLRLVI